MTLCSDVVFTPAGMMGSENQGGVRTGRVSGGIRQGVGSRPSAVCPEKLCLTQSEKTLIQISEKSNINQDPCDCVSFLHYWG